MFSLEKIRLQGDFIEAFQCVKEPIRKMGTHFLVGPVAIGLGEMTFNLKWFDLDKI